MSSLEYLKILFTTSPDADIQRRADDENSFIMKYLTFGFAVAELIAIAIFILVGNGRYNSNYSIKQASIGFLINFAFRYQWGILAVLLFVLHLIVPQVPLYLCFIVLGTSSLNSIFLLSKEIFCFILHWQ